MKIILRYLIQNMSSKTFKR